MMMTMIMIMAVIVMTSRRRRHVRGVHEKALMCDIRRDGREYEETVLREREAVKRQHKTI